MNKSDETESFNNSLCFLSFYLSVFLSVLPSVYQSVCCSLCPFFCLCVIMSICNSNTGRHSIFSFLLTNDKCTRNIRWFLSFNRNYSFDFYHLFLPMTWFIIIFFLIKLFIRLIK